MRYTQLYEEVKTESLGDYVKLVFSHLFVAPFRLAHEIAVKFMILDNNTRALVLLAASVIAAIYCIFGCISLALANSLDITAGLFPLFVRLLCAWALCFGTLVFVHYKQLQWSDIFALLAYEEDDIEEEPDAEEPEPAKEEVALVKEDVKPVSKEVGKPAPKPKEVDPIDELDSILGEVNAISEMTAPAKLSDVDKIVSITSTQDAPATAGVTEDNTENKSALDVKSLLDPLAPLPIDSILDTGFDELVFMEECSMTPEDILSSYEAGFADFDIPS